MNLKLIKKAHLWYVVGLITTDGNLSKDKRHIILTSKDGDLLEAVRHALLLNCSIIKKARAHEQERKYSVLQFSAVNFYNYLLGIGLTTKKSLTLGSIHVPDNYFGDFLRGVIDGDGNIHKWVHHTNRAEQWCLRITSAAPLFSKWLKDRVENKFGVKGKIYNYHFKNKKNPIYIIKFGKVATKIILKTIYYNNCLALLRKAEKARECIESASGWSGYNAMVI